MGVETPLVIYMMVERVCGREIKAGKERKAFECLLKTLGKLVDGRRGEGEGEEEGEKEEIIDSTTSVRIPVVAPLVSQHHLGIPQSPHSHSSSSHEFHSPPPSKAPS